MSAQDWRDLAGVFRKGKAASQFFTDDDAGALERVRWVLDEMADAADEVAVRREAAESERAWDPAVSEALGFTASVLRAEALSLVPGSTALYDALTQAASHLDKIREKGE